MRITEKQLRLIIREELERSQVSEAGCMDEADMLEGEDGLEEAEGSVAAREYGGEEYKASRGSLAALKGAKGSKERAVKGGKFAWAEEPYAAARAAEIVATGKAKPTR
jgi:hypothetical protein